MSETLTTEQSAMVGAILEGRAECWLTAPDSENDEQLKRWQERGWFVEDREKGFWPVLVAYRMTDAGRAAFAPQP